MVMSMGATTKRSKLLKKAASCRSCGPPEASLDARTMALPVSLIRQPPFMVRVERNVSPAGSSLILVPGHTSASYPHTKAKKHR
jgi:hypothetical protein